MARPIPNAPRCPKCGLEMRLARSTPRVGGLPELLTFECRPCGTTVTEVVEDSSAKTRTHSCGG